MNYYEHWQNSKGNRDLVFNDILKHFQKPITILEIGVSRNLNPSVRGSDGWSSLYFGNHIKEYGGKLISVDLDELAINNCKILCEEIDKEINHDYYIDTGTNVLSKLNNEEINFIYLDGGDDPQEMIDEYDLILSRKYIPFVLCDDYHTKGQLIRQKYPIHTLYKWPNNPHEMAFYGDGKRQLRMMQIIE